MGESFSGQEIPDSWPGHLWLEGRTIVHLKDGQARPTPVSYTHLRAHETVLDIV